MKCWSLFLNVCAYLHARARRCRGNSIPHRKRRCRWVKSEWATASALTYLDLHRARWNFEWKPAAVVNISFIFFSSTFDCGAVAAPCCLNGLVEKKKWSSNMNIAFMLCWPTDLLTSQSQNTLTAPLCDQSCWKIRLILKKVRVRVSEDFDLILSFANY